MRDSFEEIRAEKLGSLYQCVDCGGLWFLDSARHRLSVVPAAFSDVARHWFTEDIFLTDQQLQAVERIGLLGSDRYGNQAGQRRAPCAIEWRDGRVADPCVLIVSEVPPVDSTEAKVELFQGVHRVRESDYALALRIRRASRQAREVRMGFAPLLVSAGRKNFFVLNGATDVFSFAGFSGKDIRLPRISLRRSDKYPVVRLPTDLVTFVYARKSALPASKSI